MVKDSIVEQAEMTISGKCANWLADRKTDDKDKTPHRTATTTIKPITDPCDENPISVNTNTNLYDYHTRKWWWFVPTCKWRYPPPTVCYTLQARLGW